MKKIRICDITADSMTGEGGKSLTFREKIELSRLLDRLGVSVIELGKLNGQIADNLLIKSVAAAVQDSVIAVCPGFEKEDIIKVNYFLAEAKHKRLQVCAAVSVARMEYVYGKKADGMMETAIGAVKACRECSEDVEFIAEDATRADLSYLAKIIGAAIEAGAGTVTVCDTAGVMLPDEFGEFIRSLYEKIPALGDVTLGVRISDSLSVANASAVAAIKAGAGEIKVTSVHSDDAYIKAVTDLLNAKSDVLNASCAVKSTEINRILKSIENLYTGISSRSPFEDGNRQYPTNMSFTENSSVEDIVRGAEFLGYDIDDADKMRIYKAFSEIAVRKGVIGIGELDAIIASEAMQVPPTYTLENFIVTTGNDIDILAHVKLRRGDEIFDGLSLGDGPIDAAFLAIEKITGHHYELDDFQLQAITEGREAMGQTIVKLRSGGKVYPGRGISTDIIGSGVAAYVNALNKILYEEENQ